MRITKTSLIVVATVVVCAGVFAQGRGPVAGDHSRVPPVRVPSIYFGATDIETGLDKLDPKVVATPTGGQLSFGQGLNAVERRRVAGPQYAITHTREEEFVIVTKGGGTMVTGGTLIPPTIDSDMYPNTDQNAIIRSSAGVKDGTARRLSVGDVIINPPGTPHWLSSIDGSIEYVEIRLPDMDPLPGIERAEVAPAGSPSHDHMRVPPKRDASPYFSAADIQAGLDKLDPKLVASPTGGAIRLVKEVEAVVRRRVAGPQYAITHTRDVEYVIVLKGSATMVTGGTLVPPTIPTDIYPNPDPNATIRSASGVNGGLARRLGVGDVIINTPGTPHWLSQIDGEIEYVEIHRPNVDPGPGVERAEVATK
jgi:mannose-6-phosphate isomerase-like protein (cupin superfamily)